MKGHVVLSDAEAREITGGRRPLVPVVYDEAIKALGECISLDEAKQWDNKADALAAWAKIYRDDKVSRQARALKLHAYRRMGLLARELNPTRGPRIRGARSELKGIGMKGRDADAALYLADRPEAFVASLTAKTKIPTPGTAVTSDRMNSYSDQWKQYAAPNGPLMFLGYVRRNPASGFAGADERDAHIMRRAFIELSEYCDGALQFLERTLKKPK